jgi:hypothetical protein
MGKREDEQNAKREAERRGVERYWRRIVDDFEKDLGAPESHYGIAVYQRLMHRAIMHHAMRAMREGDYSRHYTIDCGHFDRATGLIEKQTKLALSAHKIDIEIAKLERQVSADALKRHIAQKSRKFWDQPHASHFEPDKHVAPGAQSAADVRLPALQGPNEEGDGLP